MISSTSVPNSLLKLSSSISFKVTFGSLSGLSLINLGNLRDSPTFLLVLLSNFPFPRVYIDDYEKESAATSQTNLGSIQTSANNYLVTL